MGGNGFGFLRLSTHLVALRQGGWMLIATVVTGVFNYLSSMFVGRMLGPSDYSIYAAMLVFFTILTALTGVAQIVVTNYSARLTTNNDWAGLRGFAWAAFRWLVLVGLAASAMTALGARWLSRTLQVVSPEPVWVLAAAIMPSMLTPLGLGLLLGQQRFGWFGSAQIAGALIRLASGVAMMYLGAGVAGAVASLIFMSLSIIFIAFVALPKVRQNWKERAAPKLESLRSFLWYTAIGTLSYTLLTGMDVLIGKSRFTPVEAGQYAAVATVGKIGLWLPVALTALIFPKLVARRASRQATMPLLRTTQLAILGLCSIVTFLFFLAGPWLMNLLFGDKYLELAHLLGFYGFAMMLYALVGLWFYYFLAMEQTAYIWILAASVVLQTIVLYVLASDVGGITIGLVVCGLTLVIAGEGLFRFTRPQLLEIQTQ